MTPKSIIRESSQDLCLQQHPSSDHPQVGADQEKWPNIQILTLLETGNRAKGQISSNSSLSNEMEVHL
jgi:hypothetical protein